MQPPVTVRRHSATPAYLQDEVLSTTSESSVLRAYDSELLLPPLTVWAVYSTVADDFANKRHYTLTREKPSAEFDRKAFPLIEQGVRASGGFSVTWLERTVPILIDDVLLIDGIRFRYTNCVCTDDAIVLTEVVLVLIPYVDTFRPVVRPSGFTRGLRSLLSLTVPEGDSSTRNRFRVHAIGKEGTLVFERVLYIPTPYELPV